MTATGGEYEKNERNGMPEERLYVKIVMPKQGKEKKKTGGGAS